MNYFLYNENKAPFCTNENKMKIPNWKYALENIVLYNENNWK